PPSVWGDACPVLAHAEPRRATVGVAVEGAALLLVGGGALFGLRRLVLLEGGDRAPGGPPPRRDRAEQDRRGERDGGEAALRPHAPHLVLEDLAGAHGDRVETPPVLLARILDVRAVHLRVRAVLVVAHGEESMLAGSEVRVVR